MKKIILAVLVVSIIVAGTIRYRRTPDERSKTAEGYIPLRVMILDAARIPEEEGTLRNNRWTRWVHDSMLEQGIDVSYSPQGQSLFKHTLMMATGSAPDLTFTHGRLLFMKYAADGGLHDLGPYLDASGGNIQNVLGEDLLKYGRVNGVQYSIPSRAKSQGRSVSVIRKDWLDALGLEVPTNREELENALRAFKEQDPGGIGSDKVVPWGFILADPGTVYEPDFQLFDVMYSFMEHNLEKNTAMAWPSREGFEEFHLWMNNLYAEGLLDPEFATLSEEDKRRKVANGQVGFIHHRWNMLYGQDSGKVLFNLANSDTGAEYVPVEVFQNDEGDYRKVLSYPVHYYAFVPENSDNPEAAVRYLNWLLDEQTGNILNFGIENEHYTMVDGMPTVPDPVFTAGSFGYIGNYLRILGAYPVGQELLDYYDKQSQVVDFDGMDILARDTALKSGFNQPFFQEEMPRMMSNGPRAIKTSESYWVKLLTEKNFDRNYRDYISKLGDSYLVEINEERADYFRRNGF